MSPKLKCNIIMRNYPIALKLYAGMKYEKLDGQIYQ